MLGVQGTPVYLSGTFVPKPAARQNSSDQGMPRRELHPCCQGMGTSSKGIHVAFAAQLGLGTQRGVPQQAGMGCYRGLPRALGTCFVGGARAGAALRTGGPICRDASRAALPLRGLASPTAWPVTAEGDGSNATS